jgi:hypothetical protein
MVSSSPLPSSTETDFMLAPLKITDTQRRALASDLHPDSGAFASLSKLTRLSIDVSIYALSITRTDNLVKGP